MPVEHIIVRDDVGLGIGGMYADIRNHAHKPTGRYVMVLSDDNVLETPEFAATLEEFTAASSPDVVMFKGLIGEAMYPTRWKQPPELGQIDLSCFAVTRPLWEQHAPDWGQRYEGDFDFINHLWGAGYTFAWLDIVAYRALRVSGGAPEE